MKHPRASFPRRGLAPLALAAGLLLPLLVVSSASARHRSLRGAPALRKPLLLHEKRHALTPSFGFTTTHPYKSHFVLGLRYDYFPLQWLGVGAEVDYAIAYDNKLGDRVKRSVKGFASSKLGVVATAGVTLVPLYGKLSFLGGGSVRWDAFIRLGGGLVQVQGAGPIPDDLAFGPKIALGGHFYFSKRAAVLFEVSDTLVSMHSSTDVDGGVIAKNLENLFMVQFGVLVHFPEKARVGP